MPILIRLPGRPSPRVGRGESVGGVGVGRRILVASFHFSFFIALLMGCGKPSPPPLLSEWERLEQEEAASLFQEAYETYQDGELEEAINGFKVILRRYPESPEGQDAAYLLMLSHYRLKNYDEVLTWSSLLLQDYPDTPYRGHALLFEARIYTRNGEYFQAALRYGDILNEKSVKGELTSLSTLLQEAESALQTLLHERLNLSQLKELLKESPVLRPKLLLEMGNRELKAGRREEGVESLSRLVEEFPESEAAGRARKLLKRYEKKAPTYKLGLLLPLTGEAAPFGRAVFRGVELALGMENPYYENRPLDEETDRTPHSDLFLPILKDTEGDPIIALEMAKELIEEEDVLAIVGPVLSLTTIPVAARANDHNVVLISPTATEERIPMIGPYVFQLNPSIRIYGRTIARFAIEKFGISRFALLYPTDGYGEEMVKVFMEEVERLGGKILAREAYPPGTTDFQKRILRLKRTAAEALFIPAHPDEILLIAPQLRFHGVEATILGGSGWGSEKVVQSKYAEGTFFPSNPLEEDDESGEGVGFAQLYREAYGVDPSRSAALGYDTIKILESAVGGHKGKINREKLRERLSTMGVFTGVSGSLSLAGEAIQSPSVWTIVKGEKVKAEINEETPQKEENGEENVNGEKGEREEAPSEEEGDLEKDQ
ncbi:penicillin-binding protein activator [candidate division TA06 bacterium]|nr:penicillin-binding protein activator [candidate division TA06 bacterium]